MFDRITIVFENCESITLKHEDVLYLKFYGTDDDVSVNKDGITINKTAQSMCMLIKGDAKPVSESLYGTWVRPAERTISKDITQIVFIDKNQDTLSYQLIWPKGCEQFCDGQSMQYVGSTTGILINHVGKKKHKKYMLDEKLAVLYL